MFKQMLMLAALFLPVSGQAHPDTMRLTSGNCPGACASQQGKPAVCCSDNRCHFGATCPTTDSFIALPPVQFSYDDLLYVAIPKETPFRCEKGLRMEKFKDGYRCVK